MNGEHDFDQWLQREMTRKAEYLEDAGFTDRVMAAVPGGRRRRVSAGAIGTILLALLAGTLALALFPGWEWGYALAGAFIGLSLMTLVQLGLGVALILAVAAAVALWSEALWR